MTESRALVGLCVKANFPPGKEVAFSPQTMQITNLCILESVSKWLQCSAYSFCVRWCSGWRGWALRQDNHAFVHFSFVRTRSVLPVSLTTHPAHDETPTVFKFDRNVNCLLQCSFLFAILLKTVRQLLNDVQKYVAFERRVC